METATINKLSMIFLGLDGVLFFILLVLVINEISKHK